MNEIILLMALLFAVYLFLPSTWLSRFASQDKQQEFDPSITGIPEDSVLRRHYITELRSQIELELFPRPTDFNLQRHYDALVNAELENRLAALTA